MTPRSRASGDGSPGRPHTRVPPLGRREAAVGGREHRQGRVRASPPPKALVGSHFRHAAPTPGPQPSPSRGVARPSPCFFRPRGGRRLASLRSRLGSGGSRAGFVILLEGARGNQRWGPGPDLGLSASAGLTPSAGSADTSEAVGPPGLSRGNWAPRRGMQAALPSPDTCQRAACWWCRSAAVTTARWRGRDLGRMSCTCWLSSSTADPSEVPTDYSLTALKSL